MFKIDPMEPTTMIVPPRKILKASSLPMNRGAKKQWKPS